MIAGPRPVPGTAQVIYYNQTSAQKAEECLNYTELDGMSIIVRRPTIHDVKDTFRNPYSFLLGDSKTDQDGNEDNEDQESFPDQEDTVISTPSALKREKKEHTVGTYADGALKKKVFTGYYHPQYADKRATCGFGYKPYGLSAAAEAFEPRKSPVPRSASSASLSKYAPPQVYHKANPSLKIRSISQPILLTDPTRLIIQNIPSEMKTQEVFIAIRETLLSTPSTSNITLHETSLALDSATGESQGVAVIRVGDRKESTLALEVLNGNYLIGYGEYDHVPDGEIRMPLKVKLFEPRGSIEKGLQFTEQKQKETDAPAGSDKVSEGAKGPNRALTPISVTKQNTMASKIPLPTSPLARSSSTLSNTTSTMTKASIQSKHRNLLNTALEDLSPDTTKHLFMNEEEKKELLDALLECLSEEERKRCMFEEEYLIERCMALKELYFGKIKEGQGHVHEEGIDDEKRDDSGTAEDADRSFNAPESPSRIYDRKELLKVCVLCMIVLTPHTKLFDLQFFS